MVRVVTKSTLKTVVAFTTPLSKASARPPFTSALHLFDEMPHRTAFACHTLGLLKTIFLDPHLVASVHCLCLKTNAIVDLAARTSVLTAYARVCELESCLGLLDESVYRDVVFWNAALSAFAMNCHFRTAIALFREMVDDVGVFDSTTLVILLSVVARIRDLRYGTVLHGALIKRSFDADVYLCNALIGMYGKCGDLSSSELVFYAMQDKDVASWNSILSGSYHCGFPEKTIFYFRMMRGLNVRLDELSLSTVITACSSTIKLLSFGKAVHGLLFKLGYEKSQNCSVTNSLITFYCRHAEVLTAQKVFRVAEFKNVVSWNSIISGLLENGRVNQALDHFLGMRSVVQADETTLASVISVCGDHNLLYKGKSVHAYAIHYQLDSSSLLVRNCLIDMYIKCNDIDSAAVLFNIMPSRDLISWNMMISGYSYTDSLKEDARVMFYQLLQTDQSCTSATLLAVLPSCTSPEDLNFGKSVHCWAMKFGLANNIEAVNSLMFMYINCEDLTGSIFLLKSILPVSDIVSWNTMIVGFVQHGYFKEALDAFDFLHSSLFLDPDPITLGSALNACGNLRLSYTGQVIHSMSVKNSLHTDLQVKNALLTMYFRCGDTKDAETVFNMDEQRNLCTWNCMISGFVHNKQGLRSLEFFRLMGSDMPNEFSIVSVICACTQAGDLRHGMQVNGHVFRFNLLSNPFIVSALVDMYSKCGRLDTSVKIFEGDNIKSIACWNSMISAYGYHGNGRKAVEIFWKMCDIGAKPTQSTFVSLFSAYSLSGLVEEGLKYYKLMSERFEIEPTVEHYVWIVDMLSHAGRIEEAYEFIERLPIQQEPGVWGALLSGCRNHSNLKLGKSIAEHLFRIDPENTGYYVTLSNMYAYNDLWADATRTRSLISEREIMKPQGYSIINVSNGGG